MIETSSPILRFPDFAGKWNTKKLSSYPVSYTHLRAPRDQRGSRMPSSA